MTRPALAVAVLVVAACPVVHAGTSDVFDDPPPAATPERGDQAYAQVSAGLVSGFNEDVRALAIESVLGGEAVDKRNDRAYGGGLHVALLAGANDDRDLYVLAEAGLEVHSCLLRGVLCSYLGADLGIQRFGKTVDGRRSTNRDPVLVLPRLGVDWGVGKLRFRFAGELQLGKPERDDQNVAAARFVLRDALAWTFTVGWRFLGR